MPKSHDPAREHRILYEIIVDAYDEEEQRMSWYYYLEETLEFPFEATARFRLKNGQTEIKAIRIVEIDPKGENGKPLRFGIASDYDQPVYYIDPETIVGMDTTEKNLEAVNDWLY
jgi:Calcium binding